MTKFECGGLNVKYPHLGVTTLPNLEAKLHLGAIRNELYEIHGQELVSIIKKEEGR